jgi:hypothetical protein
LAIKYRATLAQRQSPENTEAGTASAKELANILNRTDADAKYFRLGE